MSDKTVGIDLGTTNSVVAVLENGEPVVIPLAEGARLCPSVVGFTRAGERLVGSLAKRQAITAPERTVAGIKRHMGDPEYRITIDKSSFSPSEISAMILQKLKTDAEAYLGQPVTRAVITVPAYFNDGQRQATKDAGRIAGLDVLHIINEPTAAALAYGLDKTEPHTLLVWDLGGGTFDVSILRIGGDGTFTVKATCGDTHLGGDDWDERVIDELTDQFEQETGIDVRGDRIAMQRLKDASEKAKTELSTLSATPINLPFLAQTTAGSAHIDVTLTRARLEYLTDDLRERLMIPTRQALRDAKMKPAEIDRVVLVGGSTRMPAVQDLVRNFFGREPFRGTNPDEVVALGAAVQADILASGRTDLLLLDVTPLSLGIETMGGATEKLLFRNSKIPSSAKEEFTTSVDGQTVVLLHVVQGEREMATDNRSLARIELRGIPPMPAGIPKIEVTFFLDMNGILRVSATESRSGARTDVRVKPTYGLAEGEVRRMVRESFVNADEDFKARMLADMRNEADSAMLGATKLLAGYGQDIPEADRQKVETALTELREARDVAADHSGIRARMDALDLAGRSLAEAAMSSVARSIVGGKTITEAARVLDERIKDERGE